MPWWLLIKNTAPHIKRFLGMHPDKYYKYNYDSDKNFYTDEYLISGNRIYNRIHHITPGEKPDTTISVRTYPNDEVIGVYRSPYYDGDSNANEPMDVDSWKQVNNKIDAGKRKLILGHQDGGTLSKHPGRYTMVSGIGYNSEGHPFNYTEESDNDLGLARKIRDTNSLDSLIFVNTPTGQRIFSSPYKPRPIKIDQMSPEMWKKIHDYFDELKRQWIENKTMR